jgi:single-strand DNA-binding protein
MINNCTFMGRLCVDPEPRQTRNGKSVTSFDIAVQRTYDKEHADFIPIVCWGGTADFVTSYFHKGDMIAVEGKMQQRIYEDSMNNKKKVLECIASNVSFCSSKGEMNAKDSGYGYKDRPGDGTDEPQQTAISDDELPF